MKAQRRHELKQNSLVKSIAELSGKGNYFQQYQSQILLGCVVVALIIVVIRYRLSSAQERINQAQQSLSLALEDLKELKQLPPLGNDAQRIVTHREDLYSDGVKEIENVLAKAPGSQAITRARRWWRWAI